METDCFLCLSAILTIIPVSVNLPIIAGVSFLLLIVASLIAGAEVAVLSLSTVSIEKVESKDDRISLIIKDYVKDPERLHLTVSIATIFIVVITFFLFIPVFQQFAFLENSSWLIFLLTVVVFSLLLLLFIELIPRFFSSIAEKYLLVFAIPVKILEIILTPISYMIENLSGKQGKRLQVNKHHISIEDISSALEFTTDSLNDEEEILKGIVNFGNIDVQKILKPRIDVIAVDKDIDGEELYQVVVESGYSRIPVFSEGFDNIVGILYVKDLLPHLKDLERFDWNTLIRPPYVVPETKKVKELLKEFQTKKIHMAVVVDEYGGTAGIVTLEDILEEIVGEIADESDEDEQTFVRLNENTFIFEGITLLTDFYDITKVEETIFDQVRGDADTLAGLILELKGEIPENGDEIEFPPFLFIVEQVDNQRIKQVKVINKVAEETAEDKP